MEENKRKLSKRILEIREECNNINVKQQLQLIYDRLNEKNSLESISLIQRAKNVILRLNPKYRRELEESRMQVAIKELGEVISNYIITEQIFKHDVLKGESSSLGDAVDGFLDMYFGIEFNEDDNTLKRYQINLTDDIKAVAYREVLSRMQQAYINGGTSVQDLVKQTESKYQQEIEGIKKKAKTMEIIPYYGDRKFMEYRIEYIMECIKRMLQHPKFQNREDIMQELLNVQDFYMTFKNISLETDSIPQQKNNYRLLEELYKQVVGIEDKLSKDVEELWLERMAEKNLKKDKWHILPMY